MLSVCGRCEVVMPSLIAVCWRRSMHTLVCCCPALKKCVQETADLCYAVLITFPFCNTIGLFFQDVIDEAITFFRANVFFRNYEIRSESDRVLIYLTLYITDCLKRLQRCNSKQQAQQEMYALAHSRYAFVRTEFALCVVVRRAFRDYISSLIAFSAWCAPRLLTGLLGVTGLTYVCCFHSFDIPGDPGFPLNSTYSKPASPNEADTMKQYLLQIRQECGTRLIEKVFGDDGWCPQPIAQDATLKV